MSKKIRIIPGDILKIPVTSGDFLCFGRVITNPLIAFYDLKEKEIPSIEKILSSPILFKIWVMNHAITSGRWSVIGNIPLENPLREIPKFFKKDPITKKFSIYHDGIDIPSNLEECTHLERAAVWEPIHIEERLLDYYNGKLNQWIESLKAQ